MAVPVGIKATLTSGADTTLPNTIVADTYIVNAQGDLSAADTIDGDAEARTG